MEISPIPRFSWQEPVSNMESAEAIVRFCQGILGERPKHEAAQGPLGRNVTFESDAE